MTDTMTTYRTVTPYLVVPDADREMTFLKTAFDAVEVQCDRKPDGTVMHAELRIGDSLVMLGQAGGPWGPKPASLYLWVPDVDAKYAKALAAGAVGALLSAAVARLPTGPVIVLVASAVLVVSLLLAPRRGLVWAFVAERRVGRRIRRENLLKDLYRWGENAADGWAASVPLPFRAAVSKL